ncbi:histidinol dehydrogenase [Mesorhizobium shangrilense]|uniref:Histidinol dehydrogenase n=1 Tax=Mesorhizobium shangrilense TaxID=460060 RepID=A0ABV2DNC1_9HYPH
MSPVAIHELSKMSSDARVRLLERTETDLASYIKKVEPIIEAVRTKGDSALTECAARFDGVTMDSSALRVPESQIANAEQELDSEIVAAIRLSVAQVTRFHQAQMPDQLWLSEETQGALIGDRWTSIDSVACYVPRGKGFFPSSAIMTAVPAKVAGVARVIIVTPPGPDGSADAATRFIASLIGVDEIYLCGGAQAVAAVAYGTETVPRCAKIVGPGSPWVSAARQLLSNRIDPGSPAGPSELLVYADSTVPAALAALELTVESEHGPDSSAFVVTADPALAKAIAAAVPDFWSMMGDYRADFSRTVLGGQNGGIVLAPSVEAAFDFINDYAAEHLSVLSTSAFELLPRIRNAGEILLGPHSAIPIANFVLGPSHVLPTGGRANTASPLAVFDFMKRSSIAYLSKAAYERLAPAARTFARYEGFAAHANSVSEIRDRILSNSSPSRGP